MSLLYHSEFLYFVCLFFFLIFVFYFFLYFLCSMVGKSEQLSSQEIFALEDKHGCRNYAPVPVAVSRAEGKLTLILQVDNSSSFALTNLFISFLLMASCLSYKRAVQRVLNKIKFMNSDEEPLIQFLRALPVFEDCNMMK